VSHGPAFEFHIARPARDRYGFTDTLFSLTGNVVLADLAASRVLAHRMNVARDAARHPERAIPAGALNDPGRSGDRATRGDTLSATTTSCPAAALWPGGRSG
jgi:hypothetical protein